MSGVTFFLPMVPPTVTHQEHEFRVVKGRVQVYEPERLKDARQKFMAALLVQLKRVNGADYVFPLGGPVRLMTKWVWPCGMEHHHGEWKVTKPDTDNLIKLFKDCMTRVGFWMDDAQVVSEVTEKFWGDTAGIWVYVEPLEAQA